MLTFLASYVRLNIGLGSSENDRTISSFLVFIGSVCIWMVFSLAACFTEPVMPGLIVKFLSLCTLTMMPVAFLLFALRLARRRYALVVGVATFVNSCLTLARCFFPFDFESMAFWRTDHPVMAPLFTASFLLPAGYGIVVLARSYYKETSARRKNQYLFISLGALIANFIILLSEYTLPSLLGTDFKFSLLYLAAIVFVLFTCRAIKKDGLMSARPDYVFRKVFMHAPEAIIIVDKRGRVISANNEAKRILSVETLAAGDLVANYIKGYSSSETYTCREIVIGADDEESHLLLTQFLLDNNLESSAKALIITDITSLKRKLISENTSLLKRTYIDRLTGMYNRYYLIDPESPFYAESEGDELLSLLFIDADNFKNVNDTYGHLAGDSMLRVLADCIKECMPQDACAVRFGGDEFIVVLKGANPDHAQAIAERIRKKARKLEFPNISRDVRLSLSIGLVCGTAPLVDLIDRADRAMYMSKQRGKDMITAENSDIR